MRSTERVGRPHPHTKATAWPAYAIAGALVLALTAGCTTAAGPGPTVNPGSTAAASPAAGPGSTARRPGRAAGSPRATVASPTGATAASRPAGTRRAGIEPLDAIEAIRRGQAREALDRYTREAAELERRGEGFEAATAHVAVLIVAQRLGRYQKAVRAGLRVLELLEQEPETDQVVRMRLIAYSNLGISYGDVGDSEQARRYWEEGLALSRGLPDENRRFLFTGVFSQHLARLMRTSGNQALALQYGEEAVRSLERYVDGLPPQPRFNRLRANGRRLLTGSLFQVGETQLRLGKLGEAEAAFRRATQVVRPVGPDPAGVSAVLGLGRVALARQDYVQAGRLFQEAQTLAQRLNATPQLIAVHREVAQTHAVQGRHTEALAAYRRALDLVEDVRAELQQSELRSGFVENKQAMYHGAVQSALALGEVGEAFGYAERGRARAFLDLLGNQTLSKGKTRALLEEESRLRAQLAEARALAEGASEDSEEVEEGDAGRAQQHVEAAERAYRAFLERVRTESREQASLMTVEPVSLQEVQGRLRVGTTLLEYLVTGPETLLWVVDRERVEVVRLPMPRADLVGRVRAFRRAIAERAPSERVEALAQALEERLSGPRVHTSAVTGSSLSRTTCSTTCRSPRCGATKDIGWSRTTRSRPCPARACSGSSGTRERARPRGSWRWGTRISGRR